MVSLDKVCRRGHLPDLNSNSTVGLAKLTASFLKDLRSLESLKTLCFWQWRVLESFRIYRFQRAGLKEYTFQKRRLPKMEFV